MKKIIKNTKFYIISGAIILALILIDQITKIIVFNKQIYEKAVINGFFYLRLSQNTGCLNGQLQDGRALLIPVTCVALLFFGYLFLTTEYKTNKLFMIGLISTIGGTFGNLIDRIFRKGGVVDFLSFHVLGAGKDWRLTKFINFSLDPWPTFNLADVFLTVGVIILLIAIIFFDNEGKKKTDGNN